MIKYNLENHIPTLILAGTKGCADLIVKAISIPPLKHSNKNQRSIHLFIAYIIKNLYRILYYSLVNYLFPNNLSHKFI